MVFITSFEAKERWAIPTLRFLKLLSSKRFGKKKLQFLLFFFVLDFPELRLLGNFSVRLK